jgi:hypothetical protein
LKLYDTHPGSPNTVPAIREVIHPGQGHRIPEVTAFITGENKLNARKALCAAGIRTWHLNEFREAEGEWADMIAKSGLVADPGDVAVVHSQHPGRVALIKDGAAPVLAGEFSTHKDGGRVLTLLDGQTFRP